MKGYIEALREIKKENGVFEITLSRKEVLELINEFDRLNNIINELHKLIEQDWGYYGSFVYNSRAEFDDEEQVNKFWQDYGKKEIVKKYRDKLKELKGDSSNE